jgi:hypothetical protein
LPSGGAPPKPLLCSTFVPTKCITASASPCSAPRALAQAPGHRSTPSPCSSAGEPRAPVASHLPTIFRHIATTHGCGQACSTATARHWSAARLAGERPSRPPLLCSVDGKKADSLPPVSLSYMTSGPGRTVGPTCRFKQWLSWVCFRVELALS